MCVCARARAILCACVFAMFCMTMLILVCFVPLYTTDLYNYGYLCIVCFSLNCKALWDSESALYAPHYYYYVHPFNSQNTTTNPLQYWDLTSKSLNENICEHLWNFRFHLTSGNGQIVQKLLQCGCPWNIRLLGLCTSQVQWVTNSYFDLSLTRPSKNHAHLCVGAGRMLAFPFGGTECVESTT